MLPVISLDDEQFEEIVEKAIKMIPNLYPEWTDYNVHDPGITMLEVLAWLKEIQQFHMDQIGPFHIRKYLMLLGEQPQKIIPAKSRISVSGINAGVVLPRGSRFLASDIEFESTKTRYLDPARIVRLVSTDPLQTVEGGNSIAVGRGNMHFPLFGHSPGGGESCYIACSTPLTQHVEHSVYFGLFSDYGVKRNPVGDGQAFVPLAEIALEYYCADGFHPVEEWEDHTHQMLESGNILFKFSRRMESTRDGQYWLRLVLKRSDYEVPPILVQIGLHEIEAAQLRTLSECFENVCPAAESAAIVADSGLAVSACYEVYRKEKGGFRRYEGRIVKETKAGSVRFLLPDRKEGEATHLLLICYEEGFSHRRLIGCGNGFPDQEYEVAINGLCGTGLELLAETENGSGLYEFWEQVEDFTGSEPSSRHYCYDERSGMLTFGNCDRGMVPEGNILLAAGYTSRGQGGNVKARTICSYEGTLEIPEVINPADAVMGRDSETLEECGIRVNRTLKGTQRAVTYQDYEELVKRTPGLMIENVRAIPVTARKLPDGTMDENKVTLVVKPYAKDPMPRLNQAYLANIMNMLEPRRLIGSRVSILSPDYVGITIFAEIVTDTDYQQAREELGNALNRYFEKQGERFGQPVLYGTVYGIIDVLKTIVRVKSVSLDAQGSGIARNRNGDIILPVNGLAYLKEWDCMISC